MALDFRLSIVPNQLKDIIHKISTHSEYAELIGFIPTILEKNNFEDFGEEERIQFKKDVLTLKQFHEFKSSDFFYDETRSSSTLDYLINKLIEDKKLFLKKNRLWEGGYKIGDHICGGQGIPIRLVDREELVQTHSLFNAISWEELKKYYNDKEMIDVYKCTSFENIHFVEKIFYLIKKIFNDAVAKENLLQLIVID